MLGQRFTWLALMGLVACGDERRAAPKASPPAVVADAGVGDDAALAPPPDAAVQPTTLTERMPRLVFLSGMTLVDFRHVVPDRADVIRETQGDRGSAVAPASG